MSLQDLLFVKPGDHIVGHDMHGAEVDATIYDIDEDGLHYSYGDRFMRGMAKMSREICIREFGKYRPRIKREHLKSMVGGDDIIPVYFREKYDGLYLKQWWEIEVVNEYQSPHRDYFEIMLTAARGLEEEAYSTHNNRLEVCELLAKLAADAAHNSKKYWDEKIVSGWKK